MGKVNNDIRGALELDSKRHLGDKEPKGYSSRDILEDRNMVEVEACGTINMAKCGTDLTVGSLEGKTWAAGSLDTDLKKDGPGLKPK
ncbi:hypothetical protein V6N11_045003 [Hibiscus sabdariffa]|uniref:Uncharacterized protein n=1 Tax=Hibiscus sabdariffa TaxID=183260 RepID=A0ABR2PUI7_9ROSI